MDKQYRRISEYGSAVPQSVDAKSTGDSNFMNDIGKHDYLSGINNIQTSN